MGVTHHGKVRQIVERCNPASRIDLPGARMTPKHLGNLNVDEMRCVQRLPAY